MARLAQPLTRKLTEPLMQAVSRRALIGAAGGGSGDAPLAPVISIVGAALAFNPEMNAVGDFSAGDTVQVEYQPHGAGWTSPVSSQHVITSDELGGLVWSYAISPDLTTGDYDWRIKFKHAGGVFSGYSNEVMFSIPLPPPTLVYHGGSTFQTGSTTYTYNLDIGLATADRLVIVGITSSSDDNNGTRIISPVKANGVTLTRIYREETDRHKAWWTGIVASGDGVVPIEVTVVGTAAVPKLFWVWTLKNYNSATHKAVDGKGSNTAAVINVDVGDAVLCISHPNNATYSVNNLSTEVFTARRDDNGGSFTSYGSLGQSGELIASATRSFQLRIENPASPGVQVTAGKSVIAFR